MKRRTFEQWLADWRAAGDNRMALASMSEWVVYPGLEIYVRASIRWPGLVIERSHTIAERPGQGAYRYFMDEFDNELGFHVENVVNDRLLGYLVRRGHRVTPGSYGGPPSALNAVAVNRGCELPQPVRLG